MSVSVSSLPDSNMAALGSREGDPGMTRWGIDKVKGDSKEWNY